MKILLVEDERHMAEAVAQVLKKNNYSVDLAHDGETGLDCALSGIYDIIILDIMLPKRDGLSVLREIRKCRVKTPVILLTAKSETEDKVLGLDSGADDYLTKPFQMQELLARLRALGRRRGEIAPDGILHFGDIEYSPLSLDLRCGGSSYKLTPKEGRLLEMLMNNSGIILPASAIIEKLWGYETDAQDSHVQVYISFLRKKLIQLGSKTTVRAVRGAGYALSAAKDETPDV